MELNLNPPQRETAHYAGVMTRRTACIHDCGVQSFKKKTAGEFFFFFFAELPGYALFISGSIRHFLAES